MTMIDDIKKIAIDAGKEIMAIYNSADFEIELKDDDSPLTKADKASNQIIFKGLQELFPEIPILSEEGKSISYEERKEWGKFWLVDPLDGTKEFIKKNGEFTVNIALIENERPTMGVIYAPAFLNRMNDSLTETDSNNLESAGEDNFEGTIYFGDKQNGAFKSICTNTNRDISDKVEIVTKRINVLSNSSQNVVAVKSRSHSSDEEQKILNEFGVTDLISVGSSLKFCMVAEGKAHIYYRHGPTNEWDVGAGHAIVEAAGGTVEWLKYNKENVLNGSFLVKSY